MTEEFDARAVVASERKSFKELRGIASDLLLDKVPPEERSALLRAAAHERGFVLSPGDVHAITAKARREMQGRAGGAGVGDQFDIPEEVWGWDQIIPILTPTLVVALTKVGKTALITGLISAWHYGNGQFLGHRLNGACPPVIIAGTDQTIADWRAVLAPAGLMRQVSNGKWELPSDGPIKRLWHRGAPVYLDEAGIEDIAAECERHPGALLLCDTYAALIAPIGLDESKPEAAEPLYNLAEVIEPHGATPILLHHSSKSRAGERASNASRNSNAIPAAVSQIVSLHWLEPDKQSDKRIQLRTEGRNSRPVELVIEQVDRSQWISHGTAEEIQEARRREKVESNLSERQREVLELLREEWEEGRELTAPRLHELMPEEFDVPRKARATLTQLYEKGLADKRDSNDPKANGTVIVYRPRGTCLARGGVSEQPPQPPQQPQLVKRVPRCTPSPQTPEFRSGEAEEAPEGQYRHSRARGGGTVIGSGYDVCAVHGDDLGNGRIQLRFA